jgi:hypothetical protein
LSAEELKKIKNSQFVVAGRYAGFIDSTKLQIEEGSL